MRLARAQATQHHSEAIFRRQRGVAALTLPKCVTRPPASLSSDCVPTELSASPSSSTSRTASSTFASATPTSTRMRRICLRPADVNVQTRGPQSFPCIRSAPKDTSPLFAASPVTSLQKPSALGRAQQVGEHRTLSALQLGKGNLSVQLLHQLTVRSLVIGLCLAQHVSRRRDTADVPTQLVAGSAPAHGHGAAGGLARRRRLLSFLLLAVHALGQRSALVWATVNTEARIFLAASSAVQGPACSARQWHSGQPSSRRDSGAKQANYAKRTKTLDSRDRDERKGVACGISSLCQ